MSAQDELNPSVIIATNENTAPRSRDMTGFLLGSAFSFSTPSCEISNSELVDSFVTN